MLVNFIIDKIIVWNVFYIMSIVLVYWYNGFNGKDVVFGEIIIINYYFICGVGLFDS